MGMVTIFYKCWISIISSLRVKPGTLNLVRRLNVTRTSVRKTDYLRIGCVNEEHLTLVSLVNNWQYLGNATRHRKLHWKTTWLIELHQHQWPWVTIKVTVAVWSLSISQTSVSITRDQTRISTGVKMVQTPWRIRWAWIVRDDGGKKFDVLFVCHVLNGQSGAHG